MANRQTDEDGNISILSGCGRLRADFFPSSDTWQVDSELEDVETPHFIDWCEACAEAARNI